ncbi:MAG: hypothetical protein WCB11_01365 [Terriglobales bacterium]
MLVLLAGTNAGGRVPADYEGKPFQDAAHAGVPQIIPGSLQAAFFDNGGEGIAYHDAEPTTAAAS